MHAGDELRRLLGPVPHNGVGYIWELCAVSPRETTIVQAIAEELAIRIVQQKCPPQVVHLWQQARAEVRTLAPQERERLITFLEADFGHPGTPMNESDHRASAAVAEYLWRELIQHRPDEGRNIVLIHGPGFTVTDAGGDGLVVYQASAGDLLFRVWEVKKHESEAPLTDKVNEARDQLGSRALSYLARWSSVYQDVANDPELREFYATLVEQWQENAASAGAGVAVATSCAEAEGDCFVGLPHRFPHLVDGSRLEGLLSAVGVYPAFVRMVRDAVWREL